jgi:L-ascorbate metabolism protein UlaG (beta-lactamase superfamily)
MAGGLAAYALLDHLFAAPRYRGPVTDHFDGERFRNIEATERRGFVDFLRWKLTSKQGPWSKWTRGSPGEPPPPRITDGRLRVTYVNHATVLIQMDGMNILTDPIWSERASPVTWAGPRRVRPPGIRFEDLPRIDAVIISHNHYDHLDVATLKRLAAQHQPRFITGLGNRALLESQGIERAVELDWWQEVDLGGGLRVVSVPAQHFSGRGLSDRDRTLWCGYVLKGASGAVYFAGDTAMGAHFQMIRDRYGPIRLALLPIGAYLPRWFMAPVHISPDEAIRAHQILGASTSIAMHFGTFPLGDDGETEAVNDLQRALDSFGHERPRFLILNFGEGREVPPVGH